MQTARRLRVNAMRVAISTAVVLVIAMPPPGVASEGQPVSAATIGNVQFGVARPGVIRITYDLISSAQTLSFPVTLEVSADGGRTWTVRAQSLSGDVNVLVTPGLGKQIMWDAGKDLETIQIEQLQFRPIAGPGRPPASPSSLSQRPSSGGSHKKIIVAIGAAVAAGGAAALSAKGGSQSTAPPAESSSAAPGNRAPLVSGISFDPSDRAGIQNVTQFAFTALATDPDGDSLTFRWDFGDSSSATGSSATHIYTQQGVFDVHLTVTDSRGAATTFNGGGVKALPVTGLWEDTLSGGCSLTLEQSGTAVAGNYCRLSGTPGFSFLSGTATQQRNVRLTLTIRGNAECPDQVVTFSGALDATLNGMTLSSTNTCGFAPGPPRTYIRR